ncbi:MAG: hypothetical protein KGM17_08505 [Sphingomonadales bacterium]|nr:hypothetical protein [Sphingomonadales bacterium]
MKSALRTIAFAHGDPDEAIVALLEVALAPLADRHAYFAAAHVETALAAHLIQWEEDRACNFAAIQPLQ